MNKLLAFALILIVIVSGCTSVQQAKASGDAPIDPFASLLNDASSTDSNISDGGSQTNFLSEPDCLTNDEDCLIYCKSNPEQCDNYYKEMVGGGDKFTFFDCIDAGRFTIEQCADLTIDLVQGTPKIDNTPWPEPLTDSGDDSGDDNSTVSDTACATDRDCYNELGTGYVCDNESSICIIDVDNPPPSDDSSSNNSSDGDTSSVNGVEQDFYYLNEITDFDFDPSDIYFGAVKRLSFGQDHYPSVSPDGTMIAYLRYADISDLKDLIIADAETGNIITKFEKLNARAYKIVWSPDSTKLAFSLRDDIHDFVYIFDISAKTKTKFSNLLEDFPWEWTSDGQILFTQGSTKSIEIYSVNETDFEDRDIITNNDWWEWDISYSPDKSKLLFLYGGFYDTDFHYPRGDVWYLDAGRNTGTRLTDFRGTASLPQWLSDNEFFFISTADGILYSARLPLPGERINSVHPALDKQAYGKIVTYSVNKEKTKLYYSNCYESTGVRGICVLDLTRIKKTSS